jgi:hypothetical protein
LCVPDHFITFLQFPAPRAEIRDSRANLAARRISFSAVSSFSFPPFSATARHGR